MKRNFTPPLTQPLRRAQFRDRLSFVNRGQLVRETAENQKSAIAVSLTRSQLESD